MQSDNLIKSLLWYFKKGLGLILLLSMVVLVPANASNFQEINSAYKYNPNAAVHCQHILAASGDSLHVYLKIDLKEGDLAKDYMLGYELKESYGGKSRFSIDSLRIEDFLLMIDNQTYYLKIPLKIAPALSLMLLKVRNARAAFLYDIPFGTEDSFKQSKLVLMENGRDIPIFNSYISIDSSFRIVNSFKVADTIPLYYYQYRHSFVPALPPMAGKSDQVEKSLTIDSTFAVPAGALLNLDQEALYFVQLDTSGLQGIAFRTVESYYPKYRKAEALIAPLVYISTKSEMTKLSKASDSKKALDKYWLELIKTPSRAKAVIKSFYNQIEAANITFTTYKEGWKTDQGMIYALYGIPDEVYFNGKEEQWIYQKDDGISRVKFTFVKINNIFTDRHFELLRSKSYESSWFGNVELWRKGIKGL